MLEKSGLLWKEAMGTWGNRQLISSGGGEEGGARILEGRRRFVSVSGGIVSGR